MFMLDLILIFNNDIKISVDKCARIKFGVSTVDAYLNLSIWLAYSMRACAQGVCGLADQYRGHKQKVVGSSPVTANVLCP